MERWCRYLLSLLSSNDTEALYISRMAGNGLKKVSPKDQVVPEAQILKQMNRLYFRGFEDSIANGRLDSREKSHQFYVDLASEELKVTEYFSAERNEIVKSHF